MNLSLSFVALTSALHSVHGQDATSLRGRAVKKALATVVADSINAYEVENRRLQEQEQADTRIIGGSEAIEDRFSYAVYLIGSGLCGGSLIARDVVLTAAHCATFGDPSAILLGRHDVNDSDGEEILVREVVLHPEYSIDARKADNDFMLVFLEGTPTTDNIITVKLNSDPTVPSVGQDMTVMGWGDTDPRPDHPDTSVAEFQTASDVLMNVDVNAISNEECEKSEGVADFGEYDTYNGRITDSMLCARGAGKDSCQGDSGGPLVIKGDGGSTDVQVGVVSWGEGCALDPFPGVYARVSHAYEWIQTEVCNGSEYASEAGFDCSSISTDPPVFSPTNSPTGGDERNFFEKLIDYIVGLFDGN